MTNNVEDKDLNQISSGFGHHRGQYNRPEIILGNDNKYYVVNKLGSLETLEEAEVFVNGFNAAKNKNNYNNHNNYNRNFRFERPSYDSIQR